MGIYRPVYKILKCINWNTWQWAMRFVDWKELFLNLKTKMKRDSWNFMQNHLKISVKEFIFNKFANLKPVTY